MNGIGSSEHFMLYIQWGKKVDEDFIRLAALFGRIGVSLIPVKPNELDYFLVKRQVPVIVSTKSIKQWMDFHRVKEKHFDFFLTAGKIRLFHLNSFKEASDYLFHKQKGNYINLALPLSLKEVVGLVLRSYIRTEDDEKWPGGKRSRLPQMGGDS